MCGIVRVEVVQGEREMVSPLVAVLGWEVAALVQGHPHHHNPVCVRVCVCV